MKDTKEAKKELKEEKKEEEIIKEREDKLFSWFKKKENLWIFMILAFAIAIRLYFFFKLGNQAIWWDEAEYLVRAKFFATGSSIYDVFAPKRPILMPLIWSLLFRLGFTEIFLRIIHLALSVFGIYLTYVVGKKLFNYKIGLVASFLLTIWWSYMFYTYRLLMEIPIVVFSLSSIYFFYEWYKKQKLGYLLICGIITAAGIVLHYFVALLPLSYLIFLIFTKREVFKKRQIWIGLLIALLAFSPFIIWMGINYGDPLYAFSVYFKTTPFMEGGICDDPYPCGWGGYLSNLPGLFNWIFFSFFLIGFVVLIINIFFSFDFIIKEKDRKYGWDLFILIIILIVFSFLATIMKNFEDRYMFMLMPLLFIITSQGIFFLYEKFKKYNKIIVALCLIGLVVYGGYLQIDHASKLIEVKRLSYVQIKESSFWMKENSLEDDLILTQSRPVVSYYADRAVKHVPPNETVLLEYMNTIKPKYLMLSVFEVHPEWIYSWPIDNSDKIQAVQAWFFDEEQTQPAVIVYEFIY